MSTALTSLEVAAQCGCEEIFEILHQRLIDKYNYSPHYRPLVAPTVALPPFPFAIARCDLETPGVRDYISDLLVRPRAFPHLPTPVFDVHPLHC